MAPNPKKKRAVREVMLVRQASSRATPHGRSVGIPIVQVSPPSAHPHLPPRLLCTHRRKTPLSGASAARCCCLGRPLQDPEVVGPTTDRFQFQRRMSTVLPRGLSLGFGLGFVGVALWFKLTSPAVQQQIARMVASSGQGMHPPCASADVEARAAAAILATRGHELPTTPTVAPPPPSAHAIVAACVGGLLSLDIVMRGRSVRLGVLEPLQPDVFVAGTLNATHAEARRGGPAWQRCISHALERIAELAPFADVQIAPQPSAAELTDALRTSGHFGAYEKQASGPGTGRLRAEDMDPRLWLPTMLSPAVGNPQANTLREFHYQSRCMGMIEQAEARRRRPYSRVLFTRLDNHWLHPHPPLALLSPDRVWVPAGEDNGGVNDRHWLASRKAVPTLVIEPL